MNYRLLKKEECRLLRTIDRSELIEESYVLGQEGLRLKKTYIEVLGWDEEEVLSYIERSESIVARKGWVLGAFDGDLLVGMGSLDPEFLEDGNLKLDILYISRAYRGQGIGGQIVAYFKDQARAKDARGLYISASPFKKTVDFYREQGAEVLEDPNPRLYRLEPEDIHMEIVLK